MQNIMTKTFSITNMTCIHCQTKIENALKNVSGVKSVKVSYQTSLATVSYDPEKITFTKIKSIIEKNDYGVASASAAPKTGLKASLLRFFVTIVVLFVFYRIIQMLGLLNFINSFPVAEQGMGYGLLFLIGVLTSVHCVAMCGGITLSQCIPAEMPANANKVNKSSSKNLDFKSPINLEIDEAKSADAKVYEIKFAEAKVTDAKSADENFLDTKPVNAKTLDTRINVTKNIISAKDTSKAKSFRPGILYNLGRVISYTVIGGIVGGIGSVIILPGMLKGVVAILAGIFMVIMGLNMLSLFPALRKFAPRMPAIFTRKINSEKKSNSPFYIGLLNGLMPCGPLQAMQLYALSTGSPVKGAISMLFFSLGTVPLLFGLSAISSYMSKSFASKIRTVSASLVVILGIVMLSNGLNLSGIALPSYSAQNNKSTAQSQSQQISSNGSQAQTNANIQEITTDLQNGYEPITVKAGVPVRWTIKATANDINGCNRTMVIPEYNLQHDFKPGDNIVEFTPQNSGAISYSCWMGMISSTITIID